MPARLKDITSALKDFNIRVERPTKGSHWKAIGPDGTVYPIPGSQRGEDGDRGRVHRRPLSRLRPRQAEVPKQALSEAATGS